MWFLQATGEQERGGGDIQVQEMWVCVSRSLQGTDASQLWAGEASEEKAFKKSKFV